MPPAVRARSEKRPRGPARSEKLHARWVARSVVSRPPRLPPPPQSGIDVSDELLALYDQVKLKKAHKYITFALAKTGEAAGKAVYGWQILERAAPQSDDQNQAAFAALVKSLPEAEARFVVFDFTEQKADGRQVKKLLLIKWCVAAPPPLLFQTRGFARPTCRHRNIERARPFASPPPLPPPEPPPPSIHTQNTPPPRPSTATPEVPRHRPLPPEARYWRHLPNA